MVTQVKILDALKRARQKLTALESALREPIAIIGMACRFPGEANTPEALWNLMMTEQDCMTEIPSSRWDINHYYDANPDVPGKMYVRDGGFIKNIDQFDADFFNISPREAQAMDPQQRLLLEVSSQALETAAQSHSQIYDKPVGIYIGVSRHEYGNIAFGLEPSAIDAYTGLGSFQSILAGRLAYCLGVHGPAMILDTACSSSLVAVHQACQSLRAKDCDLALAGGISLMLSPLGTIFACKMKALSPDGRCKSFDKAANGYGRGEGIGVVVLKRLSDAIADHDNILAVIPGSAVNHDGKSSGLTVPNGLAQRQLLKKALQNAGIRPEVVTYIEAHATGTALGDPIEVNSILDVFSTSKRFRPLFLGSIKPNIGHLESAAGIASLIKVILMLQHKIIPKQLHYHQLNPHINQSERLVIPQAFIPWQEEEYFAGVSSFGLSGTNVHIILTQSPVFKSEDSPKANTYLLPLSAKNLPALEELARNYLIFLNQKEKNYDLANICFTASTGRAHFLVRAAFIAGDQREMLEQIAAWLRDKSTNSLINSTHKEASAYLHGETIDWQAFYHNQIWQKIILPTYPFQKQRYWVEKDYSDQEKYTQKSKTHPLLGEQIQSPLAHLQFTAKINLRQACLDYLKDHQLHDKPIFPATAYIEMILMSAKKTLKEKSLILKNIRILKPLFLENEINHYLYTLLEPQNLNFSVKIFSNINPDKKNNQWIEHLNGEICQDEIFFDFPFENLQEINFFEINDFEYNVTSSHLFYGPNFQNIKKVFSDFQGHAMGEVEIAENLFKDFADYYFHPAFLDSCLQISLLTLPESEQRNTFVPVGIEYLKINKSPGRKLRSYAALNKAKYTDTENFEINYLIKNENNEVILEIFGLKLQKIKAEKPIKKAEIIYRSEWVQFPPFKKKYLAVSVKKFYVILGNRDTITASILLLLKERGDEYIIVYPGDQYEIIDQNSIKINYQTIEDYSTLFEKHLVNQKNIAAILHLWSFNKNKLYDNLRISCETALYLIQTWVKFDIDFFPTIFVTQFANLVANNKNLVNPAQAALWGLIKVFNLEHPNLKCLCIDLDCPQNFDDIAEKILDEYQSTDNRIAYRSGHRYVEKLNFFKNNPIESEKLHHPFQVKYSRTGLISEMKFQEIQLNSPDFNEVIVAVVSIGLNFKDVLLALNAFDLKESDFILDHGFEFSGQIIKMGSKVKNLQIGDEVIGFAPCQRMSNFALVSEKYLIKKPENISLEQGATLPIAFTTAYYALIDCGKIGPGCKLLIHAGAGGVGLAAIQLAQKAGAEIFVTAHPDKWPFLKSKGVHHLMNSRTLDYAEQIKQLTQGVGVDIILNSLAGEFIPKNLDILKEKGIFIEIGKRNIWSKEQILACRPDVHYFIFDLTTKINNDSDFFSEKLNQINADLKNGFICPLPFQSFPINQIKKTFKFMAQARHTGKIIINTLIPTKSFLDIKPENAYLITGGLGSLGQLMAEFLVKNGVRHIILISRKVTEDKSKAVTEALKALGAKSVKIYLIDIANKEKLASIFQESIESGLVIKGIIHAAGIISDALLSQMNWTGFLDVFQAKIYGLWNLHQLSLQYPLDFLICFSSLTSVLGAYGQANYAAANAFMDACMHLRGQLGLPGITINWGPWDEKGMAANMSISNQHRLSRQGISKLNPREALKALELISNYFSDYSQFCIASINWKMFKEEFNHPALGSYIDRILKNGKYEIAHKNNFLDQFSIASLEEKKYLLFERLREHLIKIIEIKDVEKITFDTVFSDLGVDSLMAIEFANLIEADLQIKISVNLFYEFATLKLLIDYLLPVSILA